MYIWLSYITSGQNDTSLSQGTIFWVCPLWDIQILESVLCCVFLPAGAFSLIYFHLPKGSFEEILKAKNPAKLL